MGSIGIHSKGAEGTAEIIVRFSLLKSYGDHRRCTTFWKRQVLDSFSKGARRIFQGWSTGFSFTSIGHCLPEQSCVHAGALWPKWLDYFMAGKNSKDSSHQDHQGHVRNNGGSWRRDTLRATLQKPVAVCKPVIFSLQWCKAGQWHMASLESEI